MDFYVGILALSIVIGVSFIYILMNNISKAIKMIMEGISTFIEILGMYSENADCIQQNKPAPHPREAFVQESKRLRKIFNFTLFS